jgi:hypothetical protein
MRAQGRDPVALEGLLDELHLLPRHVRGGEVEAGWRHGVPIR